MYIKLFLFSLFLVLLTSCGVSESKLNANNSLITMNLQRLKKDIEYQIIMKDLDYSEISLKLDEMPYNQTFKYKWTQNDGTYQLMGFSCTGKGKGTKIAVIIGNYTQRIAKEIPLVALPNMDKIANISDIGVDNIVHIDESGIFKLRVLDKTNLGTIIDISRDKRGIILDKKIDKNAKFITLLKDTPSGLFIDKDNFPYENGQVIGDCTDEEL